MIARAKKRVVVSGMGIVSPTGLDIHTFWNALLNNTSGLDYISHFNPQRLKCKVAGEVRNFDPNSLIHEQFKPQNMARHTQLAFYSLTQALEQAQYPLALIAEKSSNISIVAGTSTTAFDLLEQGMTELFLSDNTPITDRIVKHSGPDSVASTLGKCLKIESECYTVSNACSSGLDALARAADLISSRRFEMVIAGGTDAPIYELLLGSFDNSNLLPQSNGLPQRLSKPFDLNRSKGVISEGAAFFVVESRENALARGVTPLVELLSFGTSLDQRRAEPGSNFDLSIKEALDNAQLIPRNIDYICAHGPSHDIMDRSETAAIKRVFGHAAYEVPVSSIKGTVGNPLCAGGPFQVAASIMAIQNSVVPPTSNYEVADPACDLDYVPNLPRPHQIKLCLINGHGVGGGNSTLILRSCT